MYNTDMELKYKYQETEKVKQQLLEIQILKLVFETLPDLPHIEENIRRESLLKSALFSAKVEGNPLQLEDIQSSTSKTKHKIEVFNLVSAYKSIYAKKSIHITLDSLLKLHHKVLNNLSDQNGELRQENWAIFNQAGIAIYLAPPPEHVLDLLNQLLTFIKNSSYSPVIIAAIAHFLFEKIHPFADGNGRVGRLLSTMILHNSNLNFKNLIAIEEIIEKRRDEYYHTLEPEVDATSFVEFFLAALLESAKTALQKYKESPIETSQINLLPRRQELLEIIEEHDHCSFDFLHRRFTSVNPKTLHNDLKHLQDKGLIQKLGTTRGSVYKAKGDLKNISYQLK